MNRDLNTLSAYQKRHYKKLLSDLALMLPSEIEGINDEDFVPSSAIQSTLFSIVQSASAIKALSEVELNEPS